MKRVYPLALAVTPVAIVIGLMLLPSHKERADQFIHDGRFEAAQPLLENRFDTGDRSPRVIQGIAKARFSQGDVHGALQFLDSLDKEAPNFPPAIVREYEQGLLASFSFDAYQNLKADDNDANSLRESALISALQHKVESERDILERLAETERATPGEMMRLALIEGQLGDYESCLEKLDDLIEMYPGFVTTGVIELLARIAKQSGPDAERIVKLRVTDFVERHPRSDAALHLGWTLIELEYPGIAADLLLSRGDDVFRNPRMLETLGAALSKSSRSAELLPAVDRNLRNGLLTEDSIKTLISAKIFDRNFLAAVAGSYSHDKLALNDETAAQLAALAIEKFADRELGVQFLRKASENAGPNSRSVRTLVFLWGPVAEQGAISWLNQRARTSSAADRLGWTEHLLNCGAEDDARTLIEAWGPSDVVGSGSFAMRVLPNGFRKATNISILELVLRTESDGSQLMTLAKQAKDLRLNEMSEKLVKGVLQRVPADAAANAFLAILLSETNRAVEAQEHLSRAVENRDGLHKLPPETQARVLLLYGMWQERLGSTSSAQNAYQDGFDILKDQLRIIQDRSLYAQLVLKNKGLRSAADWLQKSGKEKPLNSAEQLLLGNLLAELREFDEAKEVLFGMKKRQHEKYR